MADRILKLAHRMRVTLMFTAFDIPARAALFQRLKEDGYSNEEIHLAWPAALILQREV